MYLRTTVPVPKAPGKLVFKKKGDVVYVLLETERVYDPKRQFNIPKRVSIGKLDSEDHSRMIPNEKFTEYFPNLQADTLKPAPVRSDTLSVGAYIAFSSIMAEYGLDEILSKIFAKKAGLIQDLASYLIVNEDNAGQYYPDYARKHALFTANMKVLSDSTVSRLFSEVESDQITEFLDLWNKKQDRRQRIYISYDSTNKNSQAGDVDFVEFGHAKDDQGLPIFNVSIAFDKTNQVPLFYESYPGSINDVSQLPCMIEKVHAYGYRSIGIILDRGYFSKDNIEFIDSRGFHFLMMVKGCKALVSFLIKENYGKFETNRSSRVADSDLYGTTVKRPLYEGDTKERYFHLFFNPIRMGQERVAFEREIQQMADALKKVEGTEYQLSKPFSDYFIPHYQDIGKGKKKFLFAEENAEAIENRLRLCGYFCLISSDKLNAGDAYRLYRGRDASEKLFRAEKSFLGSKSQRVYSNESVATKLFIEFLALIVRNRFYNLLKDEMGRLNIRRNWVTVPAAIRELEKIEITRINGGRYILNYALTKNQKSILQCFGLKQDDVTTKINEIADQLELETMNDNVVDETEEDNDGETEDNFLD